jgi:hypothetical protein
VVATAVKFLPDGESLFSDRLSLASLPTRTRQRKYFFKAVISSLKMVSLIIKKKTRQNNWENHLKKKLAIKKSQMCVVEHW